MKNQIALICTSLALSIPALAQTQPPTVASVLAAAATSAEVNGLINVIKQTRKLGCAKLDSGDVTVTPGKDPANDATEFELVFNCNNIEYGADVHRIVVTGYVIDSPKKTELAVVDFNINASE